MSRSFPMLLKDNAVLVAGIALPVILLILFSAARMIPEKTVADPQYRAVLLAKSWNSAGDFKVSVDGAGKLNATYTPYAARSAPAPDATGSSRILIVDGAKGITETIELETASVPKGQKNVTMPVKEFAKRKITTDVVSPDGYHFQSKAYRSSSLVTEIFSSRNRNSPDALVKNGRIIPIDRKMDGNYMDLQFVGWELK